MDYCELGLPSAQAKVDTGHWEVYLVMYMCRCRFAHNVEYSIIMGVQKVMHSAHHFIL